MYLESNAQAFVDRAARDRLDPLLELRLDPVELEVVRNAEAQHALAFVVAQIHQWLDPGFELLRRNLGLELRHAGEPLVKHEWGSDPGYGVGGTRHFTLPVDIYASEIDRRATNTL